MPVFDVRDFPREYLGVPLDRAARYVEEAPAIASSAQDSSIPDPMKKPNYNAMTPQQLAHVKENVIRQIERNRAEREAEEQRKEREFRAAVDKAIAKRQARKQQREQQQERGYDRDFER